jgi:hypothetical protein
LFLAGLSLMTSLPSYADYGTYDESAHPDLWDGVVGYWAPCLGPTGLRLHDVSRYNSWGTLTNMVAADDWLIQEGMSALNFTSADYVDCGNKSIWDFTTPFSVAVWARLITQVVDSGIFSKAYGTDSFAGWNLWHNGGVLRAYWAGATRATGVTSIVGSRLQLLGMSWTGSVAQVWVDGKLDASAAATVGPNVTPAPLNIGRYDSVTFGERTARGQYFDAIAFNRCLSAGEWRRLYELGRGGMLHRKRRRRVYSEQAGFRAHYATQRNAQVIGGGLR